MDGIVPAISHAQVTLTPVDDSNWRAIANLKVLDAQRELRRPIRATTWPSAATVMTGNPSPSAWVSSQSVS